MHYGKVAVRKLIVSLILTFCALTMASVSYASDGGPPVKEVLFEPLDAGVASVVADVVVNVPTTETEAFSLAVEVAKRLQQTEWLPAFALGLLLLVYVLRRWMFGGVKWVQETKLGGITLAFGTSLLATGSTMILAGEPLSVGMLMVALTVAYDAAGKHGHVKDYRDWVGPDLTLSDEEEQRY